MKIYKYLAIGLTLCGSLTSCELDLYPYSAIETSQSFKTVNDAKNWSTRIHQDLRARVYDHYVLSSDIAADQLNATAAYGNNYGSPHRWTDFRADTYETRDYYQGYYSGLNNVNEAIQGFASIVPENDDQTKQLKEYTGMAHLARAYYYFQLNSRYAKAYNPTTANSDLSVALVLTPDLNGQPTRNTVKEVYDQILADLAIAKSNLAEKTGTANASTFNLDVVLALEARVKLYFQDWTSAKSVSEILITGGKYKLYNSQDSLKKMWHEDAGGEVIFAPFVSINELPNTLNVYLGFNNTNKTYSPLYLPSQWVIDFYENKDFRKNVYFQTSTEVVLGGGKHTATFINKYPGNPKLRAANAVTNYAHSPKIFRIAEIYLIAAEASYRAQNEDVARNHLNTLRVARGLDPIATTVSGNNLLNEIKAERFRELAFEGYRLEDLKRWGEGFTRRNPQTTTASFPFLENGDGFVDKSVQANDLKFTWGIPLRDIEANPNMIQNEGW